MHKTIPTAIALSALAGLAHAQSVIHASPEGSFDPTGAPDAPYPTLAGAASHAASVGGTIEFAPGTYHEAVTLSHPMILGASGPVVIGDMGSASTTLSIASLNTHLYGSAISQSLMDTLASLGVFDPLHFLDDHRATRIGQGFANTHTVDVAAFQEVWDPAMWSILTVHAGYLRSFYGGSIEYEAIACIPTPVGCIEPWLNSGLGTISNSPLAGGSYQLAYQSETPLDDPFEPFATKGLVFTEVVKDGFTIGIFNTHLQAGPSSNEFVWDARRGQIAQLSDMIEAYRLSKPSNPVIVVGDFNVPSAGGTASEYKLTLQTFLGQPAVDLIDAARADHANRAANSITSDAANRLVQYFDGGTTESPRLDYIFYGHARDGSVRLTLEWVDTVRHRGPSPLTHNGVSTIELSDHWGVHAGFRVVRQ